MKIIVAVKRVVDYNVKVRVKSDGVDIAIKALIPIMVRTAARAHFGRYRQAHHNWVIPRFRADAARAQLRAIASTM